MSNLGSRLLPSEAYQLEQDPYLLKQISMAALAELARKKKEAESRAQPETPAKEKALPLDPEVVRLRDEAEALKLEAEKQLQEAKSQAAAILNGAQEELEQKGRKAAEEGYAEGLARGSEEGYEQGRKKGGEEGLAQWAELLARWHSLLEKTLQEKTDYLADRESVMVQLVGEVAAKILATEVKSNPEIILQQVKRAIRKATDRSRLVVHLNPEDLQKAQEMGEKIRLSEGVKQIEFLADDHVMAGGVLIETANGTIDAKLETQLAEVVKGLLEEAYHGE